MKTTKSRREPRRAPASPSLATLVHRHRAEILTYLTRILGNAADAEDACQDTWLRACRAYTALADHSNLRAWLFKIATRTALNQRRQSTRRLARIDDGDPETLPQAESSRENAASARVLEAVGALPPRQRAALMQRMFHDRSYEEIALTVGGSAAAARANVYQALKRLRTVLVGKECQT